MPTSRAAAETDTADPKAVAAFLAAVAEPTRIQIVRLLAAGEKSVSDLSAALAIPMVNTSHHLGVMKAGWVVVSRKDGRNALYSFACEFETTESEVTLTGPGVTVAVEL